MKKRSGDQTSATSKKQKVKLVKGSANVPQSGARQTCSQAQNQPQAKMDSSMAPKPRLSRARAQPAQPAQIQSKPRPSKPRVAKNTQPAQNQNQPKKAGSGVAIEESSTFMATIMGSGRAPSPQATETRVALKNTKETAVAVNTNDREMLEDKDEADFLCRFPRDGSASKKLSDIVNRRVMETKDPSEAQNLGTLVDEGDVEGEDDIEGEGGKGGQMVVEDITPPVQQPRQPSQKKPPKVLLSDLEDPVLAQFAKRCARMATCVIEIYPSDPFFAWDLFLAQVDKMEEEGVGSDMGASLDAISENQLERMKLVKYMNYGPSAIRYSMGVQVRIRVGQFYGFSSRNDNENIAADVTWLLKDRKYHLSKLDMKARTFGRLPFKSPLIPLVLRGYFVEGKPEQDKLLIEFLEEQQQIPIPLIAMVTALIGHCLREYLPGQKTESNFTLRNLGKHYHAILETLRIMNQKSPSYCDELQTGLFHRMMTVGTDSLPPQIYDYALLERFAGKKRNGVATSDDEENEDDGEDEDELEDIGGEAKDNPETEFGNEETTGDDHDITSNVEDGVDQVLGVDSPESAI